MPENRNLDDIMKCIWNTKDTILHIFILTYEFDEDQLTNLLTSRDLTDEPRVLHRHLLELAQIRPLVVYDAAKTKEGRSLPQLLELHPWKSRAFGCHHSKAYCIVTNREVHLVLGSFNLTQTGLFQNREVMEHFCWTVDRPGSKDSHILRQWVDFIREHYLLRMQNSERSALQQVVVKLDACWKILDAPAQGNCALVYSGYNGEKPASGLQKLRDLWSLYFPDEEPTGLFVVSPFFDQNPETSCVATEFRKIFKSLSGIEICTSEESRAALGKGHFGFGGKATCVLRCIPRATSETERKIIVAEAADRQIHIDEDQTLERKLHAKIVLLFNGEHGISYAGSANFSHNAWLGRNQELGMVRKIKKVSVLRQEIFKELYVLDKNFYATLPETTVNANNIRDVEEEVAHNLFPDFIEYIVLERNSHDNTVRFVLSKGRDRKGSLLDYRVTWGREPLALTFNASFSSQYIQPGEWQSRLLGGRNLAFSHHSEPSRIFWFPFQYSDAIIHEKEYLLNVASADWLLRYTSNNERGGEENPKPRGKGAGGYADDNDVDRESNAVIAMQRYLQQFSSVEETFRRHVKSILKGYGQSEAKQQLCHEQLKNTVFAPLQTFFTLLRKEHPPPLNRDTLALFAFRLGELLLFVQELSDNPRVGSEVCAPLREEMRKCLCGLKRLQESKDTTLQSYLAFVLQ